MDTLGNPVDLIDPITAIYESQNHRHKGLTLSAAPPFQLPGLSAAKAARGASAAKAARLMRRRRFMQGELSDGTSLTHSTPTLGERMARWVLPYPPEIDRLGY